MHTHLSDDEHAAIRVAYDKAASMSEICDLTGRTIETVHRSLHRTGKVRSAWETFALRRELGITSHQRPGNKRPLDVHRFRNMDPDAAWLLGLAFGDGNVRHEGRFLLSCGPDKDIAEKAAAILGAKATTYFIRGCWHMEVFSKAIVQDLVSYGVVPAKTHCMKFPSLPAEVLPHFIRGLWESDGAMRVATDGLAMSFSSASCCFVNALSAVLPLVAGVQARVCIHKKEPPRVEQYRVSSSGAPAAKLVKCIYGPSVAGNRCDRKWAIAERYL